MIGAQVEDIESNDGIVALNVSPRFVAGRMTIQGPFEPAPRAREEYSPEPRPFFNMFDMILPEIMLVVVYGGAPDLLAYFQGQIPQGSELSS